MNEDTHEGVPEAIQQINNIIVNLFNMEREGLKESELKALKVSFCQTIAVLVVGLAFQEFEKTPFKQPFKLSFIQSIYDGAEEFNGNFDN